MKPLRLRPWIALAAIGTLIAVAGASGPEEKLTVPAATPIVLVFDQSLSSKTATVGQTVALHVRDNVVIGDTTVITKGTKAKGIISKVEKRKRYGINAELKIALNPIKSAYGTAIPAQPRTQGKAVGGSKSGQAAAATVGGAIIAGPIGLVGGLFIHGKHVTIKPGDVLASEVAKDTVLTLPAKADM